MAERDQGKRDCHYPILRAGGLGFLWLLVEQSRGLSLLNIWAQVLHPSNVSFAALFFCTSCASFCRSRFFSPCVYSSPDFVLPLRHLNPLPPASSHLVPPLPSSVRVPVLTKYTRHVQWNSSYLPPTLSCSPVTSPARLLANLTIITTNEGGSKAPRPIFTSSQHSAQPSLLLLLHSATFGAFQLVEGPRTIQTSNGCLVLLQTSKNDEPALSAHNPERATEHFSHELDLSTRESFQPSVTFHSLSLYGNQFIQPSTLASRPPFVPGKR